MSTKEVRSSDATSDPSVARVDPNWPDWYAEYMVSEQAGKELPL